MNDARINLTLSPSLKERVEGAAGREGCGSSEWIRFALRRALIAEAVEAESMAKLEPRGDDVERCESCREPSAGYSTDDVPLCERCGNALEAAGRGTITEHLREVDEDHAMETTR